MATGASTRSTSAARTARTSSSPMPFSKRPLRERRDDALGRVDTEIGLDQQVLEIVERRRVELALGEEAVMPSESFDEVLPRPGLSR